MGWTNDALKLPGLWNEYSCPSHIKFLRCVNREPPGRKKIRKKQYRQVATNTSTDSFSNLRPKLQHASRKFFLPLHPLCLGPKQPASIPTRQPEALSSGREVTVTDKIGRISFGVSGSTARFWRLWRFISRAKTLGTQQVVSPVGIV